MKRKLIESVECLLDDIIKNNRTLFKYDTSQYMYGNRKVPRVTHIVNACIGKESLIEWANKIGREGIKYKDYIEEAGNIGSEAHKYIEQFSNGESVNFDDMPYYREYSKNAYLAFRNWHDKLVSSGFNLRLLKSEYALVYKYFGGTIDALYDINGKIYIVDYKTSNNISINYPLQLAAYNYLLSKIDNIDVYGHIIIQLNKDNNSYNEYLLNIDNPLQEEYIQQCKEAFMSATLWFYYLNLLKTTTKTHAGWTDVYI